MPKFIEIPTHGDSRGKLSVIDELLPFKVKRTYYIYDLNDLPRGGHRHKETFQCLIAISGGCKVFCDNGMQKMMYTLDSPQKGLLIDPDDWHTMQDFKPGTILLALLSTHFSKEDYIYESIK